MFSSTDRPNTMSTPGLSPYTPPNYTSIHTVGEGRSGQVVLAIDNATIISARGKFAAKQEKEAVALAVSKIVAIKKATTRVDLATEREILDKIRSKTHIHNGSNNIVKLLNADSGPNTRWLVLSTMPICCDVHSVIMHALDRDISLPPVLVWSVFEQVYRALYFLSEVCNPPIQHGDLGTTNVLIGYHNISAQGLPSCMVIDFGDAMEGYKENNEMFLDAIGPFAQEAEDNEHILELIAAWKDEYFGRKGVEEVWKRFGDVAKATIAATTAEEAQESAALLRQAANAAVGQSEDSGGIEEAIQGLLDR